MHVHHFPTPATAAQAYLTIWIGHEVRLRNLALDALRQLSCQFYNICTFILNRLWNLQHITDFLQHATQLGIEVIMVVDDTQMRMTRPRFIHLLIQIARNAQTFLVSLLVARTVGGSGVILLSTVSSTHQMQYGIVTLAQLVRVGATLLTQFFPHLRGYICRYVHRTAIAHNECRLGTRLCQSHKGIF